MVFWKQLFAQSLFRPNKETFNPVRLLCNRIYCSILSLLWQAVIEKAAQEKK